MVGGNNTGVDGNARVGDRNTDQMKSTPSAFPPTVALFLSPARAFPSMWSAFPSPLRTVAGTLLRGTETVPPFLSPSLAMTSTVRAWAGRADQHRYLGLVANL